MPSADRAAARTTLRALLDHTARRLTAARVSFGHGTTNAQDEAAWLALHALKLAFEQLPKNLDRVLTREETRRVDALVDKRIDTRKPAAYLTHEAWLGNHRFYVDERVIVPRSFIAELLREKLAPWIGEREVAEALDLCTGSGCLAILLALTFPESHVDASDISREALEVARRNVSSFSLEGRVSLLRSDLYASVGRRRYNLIVANPPYVRDAIMRTLPTEYRREPVLALAGGRDGLDLVRRIVSEAPQHLAPGGLLVVEVGHNRSRVEKAFPQLPLVWAHTSGGEDCVFVVTREALLTSPSRARSARASRPAASPRPPEASSPGRASTSAATRRRRSARASGGSR